MVNSIDYSAWTNTQVQRLAQKADKDGVKGLNSQELFEFTKSAIENNIDKAEITKVLGSKSQQKISKTQWETNPDFEKACEYYNNKMDYFDRSDVTYKTYSNLETRLYNMEKSIDKAFIDCETYQNIVIIPTKYYRFYPNFNDKLINFNLEEIRNLTSKDMNALHELRDKVEYIMEEANGLTEHNEPEKKEFDIEKLAQKHLGMSYEEFAAAYSEELEFCKTVTAADFNSMTETQRMVYGKAKAYASEMLNTTVAEAHTTNWDIGERKTDETLKATDDMFTISEFEFDGITENSLAEIKSGIMFKAFEEALIGFYYEKNPNNDSVNSAKTNNPEEGDRKVIVNNTILIFKKDGSIYDTLGKKIK